MFTNAQRQVERTGRHGAPRDQHLQNLVTKFQNSTEARMKLNVLELFLDCITEPNERLVEFGVCGICNSCVDPTNDAVITQCGGIPLVIQCLSSPVRNTVNYALGAFYYLCNPLTKKQILNPDVLMVVREYAAAGNVNTSFSSLANAFLDKHVNS